MADNIRWVDENGKEQVKPVRDANDVFNYPEFHPEGYKPGARIVTPTTVYYHDVHGNLHHYDNHEDQISWWDRH